MHFTGPMSMSKVVLGVFRNRTEAEKAVIKLQAVGFHSSDISVLLPEGKGRVRRGEITSARYYEDAAAGAGTGALIGGVVGLLAGLGALAIPGMGPFGGAAPALGALSGLAVGGIVGGVSGALVGRGIPEYRTKHVGQHGSRGRVLLSVHTEYVEWTTIAQKVLEQTGAEDIAVSDEIRSGMKTEVPSHRAGSTDILKDVGT